MATMFNYTARSSQGKFVAGALQAETRDQALAHLRTRSLFVTSLEELGSFRGWVGHILMLAPVSARARATAIRSLAALLTAGVPLRHCLEVVMNGCRDARLIEALRSVASDVESGVALCAALQKRPREFSRLMVAMIHAGELGGSLDAALERLAGLMERDHAARKRLQSALAYPAVVVAAAIGLVIFLIANTIPAFAGLFAQMHVALPWGTRVLVVVGRTLQSPWFYVAACAAAIAGFAAYAGVGRTRTGAVAIDRFRLRLPVLGWIVYRSLMARFCRTLGALLQAGVPVLSALQAARDVMSSAAYEKSIDDVSEALRQGRSLTSALKDGALSDELVAAMIAVGEETGALDSMLLRIAEYYELDVETRIAAVGSIVEPLIIVVLGAIVGSIVAAILIPLYSMIGSIK
ncbi:MAG TPA: type II secretion system F family protein [Candidatus Aquilonibacter sp.]